MIKHTLGSNTFIFLGFKDRISFHLEMRIDDKLKQSMLSLEIINLL